MSEDNYGWNEQLNTPLLTKLKSDLKTSMRQKDITAKDAIRLIMSEFPKLTIPLTLESGKKSSRLKTAEEITNEDILDIIRGFVKSEKSVLEIKKETSSEYLEFLELYLPKMAETAAIEIWIKANIKMANFKSPMQAMGPVMKHFGKLADGNTVKGILEKMAG